MDGVQVYYHVRVLIGVVLALGITRILSGLPKFMQHARGNPIYAPHLLWVGTVLVMAIHFWWFEFGLIRVQTWHFMLFAFVLFYAFQFYLLAALLVPDDFADQKGFESYFMSRRRWFFGLLAATVPLDLIDTMIKGRAYFASLGPEYPIRLAALFMLCIIAAWTKNRRFHFAFAAMYFVYFVSYILRLYDVLE